jgi:hypothetical protein
MHETETEVIERSAVGSQIAAPGVRKPAILLFLPSFNQATGNAKPTAETIVGVSQL